ncbi:hypothetical protein AMAG_12841 [Allomyces macrogynus ATCC 38327]|uniref:Uncharacterized protein n=1 Tax=Allomyces macrogynus (strain ATCC 38327) TaxID=578462 RepID=A0A0L0T1R0_ALLM3|nr:hypothetical protein AMAG_12841 [Allomyces macrogynus ATCC 38327]|eukprot:KNE68672.1 hypothetical protein AMAG_12841 [Allomyces macrogynus ATCC 38327]
MPGVAAGPSIPASGGFGPAPRPGTGIIPADYIRVLSEWLRIPVTTTSSALVYFYRFDRYRKAHSQSAHAHGLKTVDTLLFATACVYLATKTTDCNRKIRDVLNCAHSALRPDEPPMRIDTAHWKFRESLLAAELVLLRILKFELNVDLAYWPAIQYVRHLFRVHPAPPPAPPVPPPPVPPRSPSRPRDAGPRVRRSNRMSPPPPPPPNAARRRARSRSRSRSRDRLPSITDVPPAARIVLQTAWGFVADAYLRSSVLDWSAHDIALAAVAVALILVNAEQAPDVDRLCEAFPPPRLGPCIR